MRLAWMTLTWQFSASCHTAVSGWYWPASVSYGQLANSVEEGTPSLRQCSCHASQWLELIVSSIHHCLQRLVCNIANCQFYPNILVPPVLGCTRGSRAHCSTHTLHLWPGRHRRRRIKVSYQLTSSSVVFTRNSVSALAYLRVINDLL